MFGILNINKPKGMTSFDVVARLRKILKIKQIGHTGTLDPMAQGVLPVCIGSATRLIEYLSTGKTYRATMILGITTDTYDLEGNELSKESVQFDKDRFNSTLEKYIGKISQIPPMHSAVHYRGKRLYEYARQNIKVEDIPSREVIINSIELKSAVSDSENPVVTFDVDCSGGTYIRSLVNDIGRDLGCGAVLSDLIRLRSGNFEIGESLSLEEVEEGNKNGTLEFIDPSSKIDFIEFLLSDMEKKKIICGQFLDGAEFENGIFLKLVHDHNLVAIAEVSDGKILPKKVFPY